MQGWLMDKMWFLRLFRQREYSDENISRLSRLIYFLSFFVFISTVIPAIQNWNEGNKNVTFALIAIDLAVFCALFVSQSGYVGIASTFLAFAIQVGAFFLIFTSEGLYDVAVLAYPAALVIGGLLVSNRIYILLLLFSLGSLFLEWYLEFNQIITTRYSASVDYQSLSDMMIIMLLTGIGIKFFINDFSKSIVKITRQREDLLKAHELLKEQSEQLKVSEAFNRQLIENAPDIILLISNKGIIQFSSKEEFSFLIGMRLEDRVASEYHDKLRTLFDPNSKSGFLDVQDLESKRWFSLRVSPLMPEEKDTGFILTATEITKTVKLHEEQQKLRNQFYEVQKQESIGRMAGGIAHDFNNLLSVILAHASGISLVADQPEKLNKKIQAILTATERGSGLVRQILTFARTSDAKMTPVDLNVVVREVVMMVSETFPKSIEVIFNSDENSLVVSGNSNQLHQVLMNLCVNAKDAIGQSGRIRLSTFRTVEIPKQLTENNSTKNWIVLKVEDSGSGMTEEIRRKVFEPFFTTKEIGKGTGLGLAVVSGIIQSHNGFVDLESEIGKGTTFTLYFPDTISGLVSSEKLKTRINSESFLKGVILLVEDEEDLLALHTSVLQEKGFVVHALNNPREALELYKLQQDKIELLVTNYNLPERTGLDLIADIRKINPKIPVILATGDMEPEIRKNLDQFGNSQFLSKPFDSEKLTSFIISGLKSENGIS